MASSGWIHVLTELAPLDALHGPLSRSARLCYTCISVSKKYLALGSNTGGVYIFSRDSLKNLQVVYGDVETSSVTITALSPNDTTVAYSISSGQVIIMELNIDRRCKPERLRLTADHVGFTVTALHWDQSSSKLYIGDNVGKISVAFVPSSKASTLFTQPSEVIVRLDSAVVQLDWWNKKLLVSTMSRSYLLNTNRHQYSQIGKKLRDGEFGSCFFVEPSSQYPVVYCARPGSRVWEVDFDGNVLNTHQFKKLLSVPPLPVIKFRSENTPCFDELQVYGAQSVAFNKMCLIGSFLITWHDRRIYIFDPAQVKMILWSEQDNAVQDIVTQGNEIYVYYINQTVSRFHLLPLHRCLHLLCVRKKWCLAGELLSYCDSFVSSSVIEQHVKTDTLVEIIEKVASQGNTTVAKQLQIILDEFSVEGGMYDVESSAGDVESRETSDVVRLPSGIFVVNERLPGCTIGQIVDSDKDQSEKQLVYSEKDRFENQLIRPQKEEPLSEDQMEVPDKVPTQFEEQLMDTDQFQTQIEEDSIQTQFEEHSINTEKIQSPFENQFGEELLETDKIENQFGEQLIDTDGALTQVSDCEKVNGEINFDMPKHEDLSLKPKTQVFSSTGSLSHSVDHSQHVIEENGFCLSTEENELSNKTDSESHDIHVMVNNISENLCFVADNHTEINNDLNKNDVTKRCQDVENAMQMVEKLTIGFESVETQIRTISCTDIQDHKAVNGIQSEIQQNEVTIDKLHVEVKAESVSEELRTTCSSHDKSCDNTDVVLENDDATKHAVLLCNTDIVTVKDDAGPLGNMEISEDFPPAVIAKVDSVLPSESNMATVKSVPRRRAHDKTSLSVDNSPSDIVYKHQGQCKRSASTGSLRKLKKKDKKRIPSINVEEEADINLYTKIDLDPDTVSIDTLSSVEEGEFTPDRLSLGEPDNVSLSSTHSRSRTPLYASDQEIIPSLFQRLSASGVTSACEEVGSKDTSPHSPSSPASTSSSLSSQSPRTALLSVKESLSSKTKYFIETIRKKTPLGKPSTYSNEHDTEKTPEHTSVPKPTIVEKADEDSNLDMDKFDIGHFKIDVDLSSLQTVTDSTKTKLQDLGVLMNCVLLKSHLLDWVTELHLTLWLLHKELDKERKNKIIEQRQRIKLKQEQADLSKLKNKVECDKVKNSVDFSRIVDISSQKESEAGLNEQTDFESSTESQSISASQSSEELGLSHDCNSQSESVSHVNHEEELEKVIGNVTGNVCTSLDETDLDSNCIRSNGLECLENKIQTPDLDIEPVDWLQVCHVIDPFNMSKQLHTDVSELTNLCFQTGCHGSVLKFVTKNKCKNADEFDHADLKEDIENTNEDRCVEVSIENSCVCSCNQYGTSCLQDCIFDKEMAQFVQSYFHCLDIDWVQKMLHGCDRNLFHTWSAIIRCSQDVGRTDQVGAKLDSRDVNGATDLLRSGMLTNKQVFLGHFARLFTINTVHALEFASEVPKKVSPQDIVNLCWMYSKPVEQFFSKYIHFRLGEMPSYLKSCVLKEICSSSWIRLTALQSLMKLSSQDHQCDCDILRPGSHLTKLANEDVIESVLDLCIDTVEEEALLCCKKYRYVKGWLRFVKRKRDWKELLRLIAQLGDIALLDDSLDYGYLPQSKEQWHYFLQKYSDTFCMASLDRPTDCNKKFDWIVSLSWQGISELMVKNLGPTAAVLLLQEFDIPEQELSPQFYQMCLMESEIQQRQRLVLHNMLEKIDTYLWAKHSPHMAPQLLYAVSEEKKSQLDDGESRDDRYQELFARISYKQSLGQMAEDSESHWGVRAEISSCCANCNLKLTETVSHIVPGVLVFPCGHSFHKFCIPQKVCVLCAT